MSLDRRLPFSVLQACRQVARSTALPVRSITTTTSQRATSLRDLGNRGLSDQGSGSDNYSAAFDSNEENTELDNIFNQHVIGTRPDPPYHLHVYSTKHNTHMTLTGPNRDPIISKSAGNIGFKKSARGSYDAAYQLSAFMLGQIYEGGLLSKIKRMEVILRGFGVGREAVSKALLGTEGRKLRDRIKQVTDVTRLKFGGTRSRKPRRLG